MTAQGRMLQFKYLFPWVYACWIWLNRLGLRIHWLLAKPIRVRLGDIWTVSAVAAACGVILAILLFVFRGAQSAEAQQPLSLMSSSEDDVEVIHDPAEDAFIPAALAAYQPSTPVESSIPGAVVDPDTADGNGDGSAHLNSSKHESADHTAPHPAACWLGPARVDGIGFHPKPSSAAEALRSSRSVAVGVDASNILVASF